MAAVVLAVLVFRSYQAESARRDAEPVAEAPPAPTPPPPQPAAPPAPPALGRTELLAAAAAAASEYAAGEVPAAASPIVGRRFRVRLPFGCEGPLPDGETASASWSYGPNRRSVRIVIRPEDWTDSGFVRELEAAGDVEAVEGFWIRRPWLVSAECPAVTADPLAAGPPPASPETVGLAVLFEEGGSRTGRRRARPYETTMRLETEGASPAPRGFRLLLEGRLVGFRNGRAFRCRSAGPDQRPVCIASVQIDSVAVEDPVSGELVARWEAGVAPSSPLSASPRRAVTAPGAGPAVE